MGADGEAIAYTDLMLYVSRHSPEFLQRVQDDGLQAAVAWAKHEVRPLDWDYLKRDVMAVRAPEGPKDVRVLCELSDHVGKFDSLFRDGLYVAGQGQPLGLEWARQMYRLERHVARATAAEGPWMVKVFWDKREALSQDPAWTWAWKAMWKRWESSDKPIYLERAKQMRDLIGVAMVHHLGGSALRCSPYTMEWIEHQLEQDLSMTDVWCNGASGQDCTDALTLLRVEVRRRALMGTAQRSRQARPKTGNTPRM